MAYYSRNSDLQAASVIHQENINSILLNSASCILSTLCNQNKIELTELWKMSTHVE